METYSVHPLMEQVPRKRVLCFTGHRPEKLPSGDRLRSLVAALHYYIDMAVQQGYTHFYTGLADGVDYLAAEYLFTLRRTNPAIVVIGVQPCQDYHEFFRTRGYSIPRLEFMLSNLNGLVTMPGSFRHPGIFRTRNYYMADRSAAIIAVCRNGRSGSMQTFNYAKRCGLAYCRICLEIPPAVPYGTVLTPQSWAVERSEF